MMHNTKATRQIYWQWLCLRQSKYCDTIIILNTTRIIIMIFVIAKDYYSMSRKGNKAIFESYERQRDHRR